MSEDFNAVANVIQYGFEMEQTPNFKKYNYFYKVGRFTQRYPCQKGCIRFSKPQSTQNYPRSNLKQSLEKVNHHRKRDIYQRHITHSKGMKLTPLRHDKPLNVYLIHKTLRLRTFLKPLRYPFLNFCHNEFSSQETIHNVGSFIRTLFGSRRCQIVKMTSLFRPWIEDDNMKSSADEITTLPRDDTSSREDKYKSVKEHMKKRSEKYLLKKLKLQKPDNSVFDYAKCEPPFPVCYPVEAYPALECFLPGVPGMGLRTDYLDTALSHGIPPNLFEEYAKFLTEQQKVVTDRNRKQRPKKFRCPHCHVGFSNNGQLKGHIRIHTGERPFKCDAESCGKSFTRNEELTRHRRIHSGLRPFPCSECGKRFGRKDHLKKHIKTHFQQRYQLVPILPSHCPYIYGL